MSLAVSVVQEIREVVLGLVGRDHLFRQLTILDQVYESIHIYTRYTKTNTLSPKKATSPKYAPSNPT